VEALELRGGGVVVGLLDLQDGVLLELLLDALLQGHDRELQDLHRLDHARRQNHGLVHPLLHRRVESHESTPLQNARRPSRASASIWLLANSRTEPEGKPRAKRVRRTPRGVSKLERYSAVPSPSRVGLVAMMTSPTPPALTRASRRSMVRRSGP